MIQVVGKITDIEEKNDLFSLRDKNGMPVWDVLRYDVIKHIQYRFNPNKETVPHPTIWKRTKIFFRCFTPYLRLLGVKNKRYLFYTHARHTDENGYAYDRQALDIIKLTKPEDRIIFNSIEGKSFEDKVFELPQAYFYLIHQIKNRFIKKDHLNTDVVKKIVNSVNEGFGEVVISEIVIQSLYVHFLALCEMFEWVIKKVKPEKVVISYGRYKAVSYVARRHGIHSYLIQHSLIDKADATIGGTCPRKEDGVNPDTLLTYGSYWGEYLKHLMDVKVLGNRFLYKEDGKVTDDGSVLFVSSLYQGPFMSKLLLDFAPKHLKTKFIYKLHTGEKNLREHYEEMFESAPNVSVQLNEESMASILQRCTLVVLISSTTLYEALNSGKCVAIYDIQDFADVTSFLKSAPNTYCFTDAGGLDEILNNHVFVKNEGVSFYDDFNLETALRVLGIK